MIVLEKGMIPSEQMFEETCDNCKCRFAFKKKEAKYYSGDDRYGNYYCDTSFYFLECPTCSDQKVTHFSTPYEPL